MARLACRRCDNGVPIDGRLTLCEACEALDTATERWCVGCREVRPVEQFYPRYARCRGRNRTCQGCYGRRNRARYDERSALLRQIKLDRGCADCGYSGHPAALDFDHLPGYEKEFSVGRGGVGILWSRVEAEIAKCEVVCANCHRIRTVERAAAERESA